jgi:hypothetical protein
MSEGLLALDIGLFEPRCGDPYGWSEEVFYDLLELLTRQNIRVMQCGNIPPLYLSGVRWKEQPRRGNIFETFKTIPSILKKGVADCDQLAPWRMAEIRMSGEPARFWLPRFDRPQGPLYHVLILRPFPGGWYVEDPSQVLGMPTGRQA